MNKPRNQLAHEMIGAPAHNADGNPIAIHAAQLALSDADTFVVWSTACDVQSTPDGWHARAYCADITGREIPGAPTAESTQHGPAFAARIALQHLAREIERTNYNPNPEHLR